MKEIQGEQIVIDRMEEIQKSMHEHIEDMFKKSETKEGLLYQDAANVYLLIKLAELELKTEGKIEIYSE